MSVYEDIDGTLGKLKVPFYHGMPEFGEDEPTRYIVYTVTGKPADFASGEAHAAAYMVSLSVFSEQIDPILYAEINAFMKMGGFGLMSFRDAGTDHSYPYKKQYSMDFYKNYEED